ncbi:uncharacterized protein LOC120800420 isoform X2 [Xiphias gladius]|uniref:uncharacterized protein LOC120800420 isoform X2 n=1 Tax=Xiphias gladius TaxID=8245 RepID=UPI001A97D8B1|nr:uncharacterized protein LOC120800420 isoform X2 [Xiphias gladius]
MEDTVRPGHFIQGSVRPVCSQFIPDAVSSYHPVLCVACVPQVRRCQMSRQPVPAARLPYRVKLSAGKRYAWCACGHSKKQPFCDGAHRTEAPSISPLRQRHDGHAVCL